MKQATRKTVLNKLAVKERLARDKAARLLAQARALGFVLKASVVRRRYRCGKPGCHCAKGRRLHQDVIITRKVGGVTHTIRVAPGREPEALAWMANWRKFKQIVNRLTEIELRILRLPAMPAPKVGGGRMAAGKKQRRRRRKSAR